jgi:hypothetical protein
MISLTTFCWALAGGLMGTTHCFALRRSCTTAHPWEALSGLFRLTLVGSLLTAAALLGNLFSAFAGWSFGFVLTLMLITRWME